MRPLLNQKQAAEYAGISVKKFRAVVKNGFIGKNRGANMYAPEEIERWRNTKDYNIDCSSAASGGTRRSRSTTKGSEYSLLRQLASENDEKRKATA